MKVQQIIGADLSKETIDLVCQISHSHLKIRNHIDGFEEMIGWLNNEKIKLSHALIVMEHTGNCSHHFEIFLHEHRISFSKVPALAIKRSLGIVRGKNDKIDAARIAKYGYEKRDNLVKSSKPDNTMERLRVLHSARTRLVRQKASLLCVMEEFKTILEPDDVIIQSHKDLITNIEEQIIKIESEIQETVNQKKSIKEKL